MITLRGCDGCQQSIIPPHNMSPFLLSPSLFLISITESNDTAYQFFSGITVALAGYNITRHLFFVEKLSNCVHDGFQFPVVSSRRLKFSDVLSWLLCSAWEDNFRDDTRPFPCRQNVQSSTERCFFLRCSSCHQEFPPMISLFCLHSLIYYGGRPKIWKIGIQNFM